MNTAPASKTFITGISIAGGLVGVIAGSLGMYFTLSDRMEKSVETRVTERLKTEQRLTRIEEKLEGLKSEVWTQRTTTAVTPSK